MAKEKSAALVKARVLLDCAYGKCNSVVELSADDIAAGAAAGALDSASEAVAYAESLAK